MFTGLISAVGEVSAIGKVASGKQFAITANYQASTIPLGASIACDGACMTAISVESKGDQSIITIDVSPESLSLTTLGNWQIGTLVNMERSLKTGDELGGHMVTGHVDGLAKITEIIEEGDFRKFWFECPDNLSRMVAEKGSVALNGTSLTVNKVRNNLFSVQMIPHTLTYTNWHKSEVGMSVNMEVDLMARYAARLLQIPLSK